MGLGDLVDDATDSGTEEKSKSSPSGSTNATVSAGSDDSAQHDRSSIELDGFTHWHDRWEEPTHSLPSVDERRTSEGYKRLDNATAGHRQCRNICIQYTDEGEFMGPDPPSSPDVGEFPTPGGEDWHDEWVDYTDRWKPKLLSEKQAECECGNHVWMKRRVAWLRCARCQRVLVDTAWHEWDESAQVDTSQSTSSSSNNTGKFSRLTDF